MSHHHGHEGRHEKRRGSHGHRVHLASPGEHHRAMTEEYKRRFLVSLLLTVPILALSPEVQGFLDYSLRFPGSIVLLWLLSTIVYFYGGRPFLVGLIGEIRRREPGMMTLVGIAISVAYFYSTAVAFFIPGRTFFWELATLIVVMLLGHWVEMKSILGASRALEKLVEALPTTAHLVKNGGYVDVHVSEVKPGDLVLVKPGERVPVDGVIVDGMTSVDESMITGESKPVYKKPGDEVIAGTINLDGSIKVRAKGVGRDTYLSQVIELVQQIQRSRSRAQDLANRAAKWLTLIALGAGSATFAIWLALGFDTVFALERAVTVMVIACPHALGLAVPLVVARSSAISASNGILVRNRRAFERAKDLSAVVFDKTGTLTKGELGVESVIVIDKRLGEEEVLRIAASLEQGSEHPIAKGILEYAEKRGVKPARVEEFRALPGIGVEGRVDGLKAMVVSPGYVAERSPRTLEEVGGVLGEGKTVVFVMLDGRPVAAIALSDVIREESREAVARLKEMGIKVFMLTGDNRHVAARVARELGIDDFYAEVLPHEKAAVIEDVKAKGYVTAMVGDGVNDAPALMAADVGIAIGAGTDIAIESADVVLVKNDPRDVPKLVELSKKTYSKMRQNLVWATAYNAFAIPAAAGALYTIGFLLPPALGALFMSMSTVIVAINASLLK